MRSRDPCGFVTFDARSPGSDRGGSALSYIIPIIFGKIAINSGHSEHKITSVLKHTVLPFTNKLQEVVEAGASGG